jgi:hypothetical protein
VVATSIRAWVTKQQQVDSVLLYLTHQGQHTASLDLVRPYGDTLALKDLPNSTPAGPVQHQLQRLPPAAAARGWVPGRAERGSASQAAATLRMRSA